jgi:hypothetical protein
MSLFLGSASEADNLAGADGSKDADCPAEEFGQLAQELLKRPSRKPASVETAARNRNNGMERTNRHDIFDRRWEATPTAGAGLIAPKECANGWSIGHFPRAVFHSR